MRKKGPTPLSWDAPLRRSRYQQVIASIVRNVPVADSIFLLTLALPDGFFRDFMPGMFSMVHVTETLDPLLSRPFSWAWVDRKRGHGKILYRVAGKGTEILSTLHAGETIRVTPPLGEGFPLTSSPDETSQFLVAGGIGIAPLLSVASEPTAPRPTHLVWGVRDAAHRFDLGGIADPLRHISLHLASEDGSCGEIKGNARDLFLSLAGKFTGKNVRIFACGPLAMLKSLHEVCNRESNWTLFISLETSMACGMGLCMGCAVLSSTGRYLKVCQDGPVFDATSIGWKHLHEIY